MSFSGRVFGESHEGGLLVSFEGKAPRLGASLRISGGKVIGRVETVLGLVEDPVIHVFPMHNGIDQRATIGSPVEIAPRVRSGHRRPRGRGNDRSQRRNHGKKPSGREGHRKKDFRSGRKGRPDRSNSRTTRGQNRPRSRGGTSGKGSFRKRGRAGRRR